MSEFYLHRNSKQNLEALADLEMEVTEGGIESTKLY